MKIIKLFGSVTSRNYIYICIFKLLEWCNVIDKADHFAETARNKITGVVVGGGAGSLCHSRQSSPSFVLHLPTIPLNWSVISSSTFRFTRDPPSHQQTQVNDCVYYILTKYTAKC